MLKNIMSWMTKPTVPQSAGLGADGKGIGMIHLWEWNWVEIARTIAPSDLVPGSKVLHREAKKDQTQQRCYYRW